MLLLLLWCTKLVIRSSALLCLVSLSSAFALTSSSQSQQHKYFSCYFGERGYTRKTTFELRQSMTPKSRSSDSEPCEEPDEKQKLLFSIGMIADIQYAPIPDGYSYAGAKRYYRHALEVARHAALHFETESVNVMVNLGDIVDGKCQQVALNGGEPLPDDMDPGVQAVDDVLDALSAYQHEPVIHTHTVIIGCTIWIGRH
jgi:hypothetical protein